MLRLFVAVDLPAELREEVASMMDRVRGARWANSKQLHITLRFLGDTAEEALPGLRARLATIRQQAFQLRLCGAGVFPETHEGRRAKPPRVLWLGMQPTEELASLKQAVDAALSADPAEAQFSPHLTLARFSARPDQTLSDFRQRHGGYTSAYWWVRDFHLYQSTLRREGAVHTRVASYPLVETKRGE
jgi:2'-5' RNA ligase